MMTPAERIDNFVQAGVHMGKVHMTKALDEFHETGHSCYSEGWAAGFSEAMRIVKNYVAGTIEDEAAKP